MHTIVAGAGVAACRIGADKQAAIAAFGTPSIDPEVPGYLLFPAAGVEVNLDEETGTVAALFFFFRHEEYAHFTGSTDHGIGSDSTEADVLAAYGEPTQVLDFTDEKTLDYQTEGILFTFQDGRLVDIRIHPPSVATWPAEWPLRPMSAACSWMAFVGEDGSWMQPIMHAQASFLEFARIAELERFRVVPTFEVVAIKAFFEATPGNPMFGEHIFLTDIATNGTTITATLNSSAMHRPDLQEGQEVTFPIEHLSDWFLVRLGKGYGGFTIPLLWAELPEEEQASVGAAAPFAWFADRSDTAEEQLTAIPPCTQCKRRNLMMEPERTGGVCGICQEGGRRCPCPQCGAPLIRYDKLPALCSRCLKNGKSQ